MEEFNKLSVDEQRRFIINKIINDKYFSKIHKTVNDNYCEYILEGDELVKYKLDLNNRRNAQHILNALKKYEHAVDKVMAEYSRYKDVVYNVYEYKDIIEELCKSKYINGTNNSPYNNYIFYDIIYHYYNTLNTINKYGGNTSGDEDQTLYQAVRDLLKNPYLCDGIKNDEKYKKYYDEFYKTDEYDYYEDDELTYTETENDIRNSEDIESTDEIELSDIDETEVDNSDK